MGRVIWNNIVNITIMIVVYKIEYVKQIINFSFLNSYYDIFLYLI